jgi:hypothetical protein
MDKKRMDQFRKLRWTVELRPYEAGTEHIRLHLPEGEQTRQDPGFSLAELRERLGGDEGHISDPFGNKHFVSLKQYANHHPTNTRFRVTYKSESVRRSASTEDQ